SPHPDKMGSWWKITKERRSLQLHFGSFIKNVASCVRSSGGRPPPGCPDSGIEGAGHGAHHDEGGEVVARHEDGTGNDQIVGDQGQKNEDPEEVALDEPATEFKQGAEVDE